MRWAASSLTDKGGGRGHNATGYPYSPVCVDLELSSLTRENGRVLEIWAVPGLNCSCASLLYDLRHISLLLVQKYRE